MSPTPARVRLSSPYDTDARCGMKRGSGWCGYKVRISETCGDDTPRIITGVLTTDATVTDTEMTETVHQILTERGLLPGEHVAGAGYVSAAHIVAARDQYGADLIGPVGTDTSSNGHFPQNRFRIDWAAQTVTCPQGKASVSWSAQRKASGTDLARIRFAVGDCAGCPVRDRLGVSQQSRLRPGFHGEPAELGQRRSV